MSLHIWGEMVDSATDDPVAAVLSYEPHPKAVAGYVGPPRADNRYVTFPQLVHHFGHEARCLSIGVHMEYLAEVGDFENGDMKATEVVEYHKRCLAAGFYKPVKYTSLSNFGAIHQPLIDAHISDREYRFWIADYLNDFHESRANAIKLLRTHFIGAVQFWSTDAYDVSLVRHDFWPPVHHRH